MNEYVICLNTGSSSLKFALYELKHPESVVLSGSVENIGSKDGRIKTDRKGHLASDQSLAVPTHEKAVFAALDTLSRTKLPAPVACVHRIVHGGPDLVEPVFIDERVMTELKRLTSLAPLHIPNELAAISAATRAFPEVPQIGCFDTAFHQRMPEVAKRLPLPQRLWQDGIRRYGFHGLSYESIVADLGPELKGRSIIAHLGNGCSMVALKDRIPLDTTMGLTPTGGLMMGTRSGDLDPGVLFYLMRKSSGRAQHSPARAERILNDDSGLLGVSGISRNMEKLIEVESRSVAAKEAIELFCHCAVKFIGSLSMVLGGLDHLVFTGGMGEKSPEIRKRICKGLSLIDVRIDSIRNESNAEIVSHESSRCVVRAHPTHENLMMAKHAKRLLSLGLKKGAA
jgi:acetate kinase